MKHSLIIFTFLLLMISCKSDVADEKRILNKINEINSLNTLRVYTQFEDFRKDRGNQIYLNQARRIRSSRDTINYYIDNHIFNNDFFRLVENYRLTLHEVCDSISICDALAIDLFNDEGNVLRSRPLDYIIQLSITEMDILTYLIASTGGHYGFFTYEFQFEKQHYNIEDTIKFIVYPNNTGFETKIKYDSVEFFNMNPDINKNIKMDYQLEQEVRTGIVKFKPTLPGKYRVSVYLSFQNFMVSQNQEVCSDIIYVKNND